MKTMRSLSTAVKPEQGPVTRTLVVRDPQVVFCSLADGGVLLNLSQGVYFGLDGIGARIWELLQTPQSRAELTEALLNEYDVSAEQCGKSVDSFLEQMRAQGLVQYETRAAHE